MTTSAQTTTVAGPRFSAIRVRNGFLVSLANFLLLIGVILAAVPFIYMISASFKPQNEIFTFPVQIIPKNPYLDNYTTLFGETLYLRWFFNTAIVAVGRTALSLFLCMLAGFAFAKYDFPFRRVLFVMVLASFTLPFEVVLIPLYTMMVRWGLLNTYWVLIVPFAASAFGIFLARQYALALPTELMEAARIDGSSELGIFFRIALPNLRPALAVMGIIFFQASWNDFLWPLIVLNDSTMYVINLALPTLRGPYNDQYGLVLGGAVIAVIPIIIIFFAMQRYFIEGIMAGALKG
ncbi:MAG: carbohydrate ABC transporter permease [Caldilineaceae bacterium]|nr:carbohydrate ABC transporter permease [Caldilineaceae bacterium]